MAIGNDETLIIGAGSIGATIAFELALAGHRTRLIDSGSGPGAGCSYANAGLLSPSHVESLATPRNILLGVRHLAAPRGAFRITPRPSLLPWLASFVVSARPRRSAAVTARLQDMARHSLHRHLSYPDLGVPTGVQQSGSLDVYTRTAAWRRVSRSPHATVVQAGEIRRRFPGLTGAVGGIGHPEDAHCNTLTYVSAMVDAAHREGATVQWNSGVRRLTTSRGELASVELTDGRQLSPRRVVIAAGLGSTRLCRQIGLRVPIQPATGYVIDTAATPETPDIPVTLKEDKVVLTPLADRFRAAGTLDLSGVAGRRKVRRLDAVRQVAATAVPGASWADPVEAWAGDRPTTSDGAPVIGMTNRVRGVIVATGHGMWGLTLAPITAEWIRRGLAGDTATLTDPMFSPDRFTARALGGLTTREPGRRRRRSPAQ